jgi:hypothetical protein
MGQDPRPSVKEPFMQSRLSIQATCIVIAILTCQLNAQDGFQIGGQAGSASRMGFGARGIAAANALSSATAGDALCYYNPALAPFQNQPAAIVSTGFLPFDRHLNFVSYVQHLKPSGGFSIALINAGVSNIQGRDLEGHSTESYSTSENQFLFSFGTKLKDDFAVGVSAKILYFSLFRDVKSTTVGLDVGLLYQPSKEWSLALVVGDLNSKYKWDTSRLYGRDGTTTIDRFPLRRKLAATYAPSVLDGQVSAEVEWVGSVLLTRFGTEISLHKNFGLSAGIDQLDFKRRVNPKPSFGFSLNTSWNTWSPTLHYGFVLEPYSGGGIHLLSLTLGFE